MTAAFAALPERRRALVTNHHVFGYLAERFDFEVVGAVIPGGTTLAAPSASDLADLVDAVERAGVPTIFAESSSPDRLVQALASEADVRVEVVELFTESLTGPEGGAPDYLAMMRANTQRIATGLSPERPPEGRGTTMRIPHLRRAGAALLALGTAVGLAACSSSATGSAATDTAATDTSAADTSAAGSRIAVSYAGGILVLDGTTLETLADLDAEEFTRLNPAGDGRHVLVTTSGGFQVLDTAGEPEAHRPRLRR